MRFAGTLWIGAVPTGSVGRQNSSTYCRASLWKPWPKGVTLFECVERGSSSLNGALWHASETNRNVAGACHSSSLIHGHQEIQMRRLGNVPSPEPVEVDAYSETAHPNTTAVYKFDLVEKGDHCWFLRREEQIKRSFAMQLVFFYHVV